jgi:hypothetical protein
MSYNAGWRSMERGYFVGILNLFNIADNKVIVDN